MADDNPTKPSPPPDRLTAGMPPEEFRRFGHQVIDWIADYWEHPERHLVSPGVEPGQLCDALPANGPESGEPMDRILADFERQILPHVTHWNHPGFMGYFATSGSAPGVLAETLSAGLNNIGLLWKTSPALAELELVTLRWLAEWIGLPPDWFSMIHGTASEASLHAIIAARELAVEQDSLAGKTFDISKMAVYASEHAHSSIEKATLALGLGREGTRKVQTDAEFRMVPAALERAIERDLANGARPVCVVATIGTTSTSSIDPVAEIAAVCEKYRLWLHVDAAYAGSAAILPEKRELFRGWERADSVLLNPHKWLFTPMDLTAFYCRRPEPLRRAFSLVPEFLRSKDDPRAVNFMEYAIPLGRRFRALKLWFVMRYFGRQGLAAYLREHIRLAQWFASQVDAHPRFERMAPAPFSLVCFRCHPPNVNPADFDELNQRLLDSINDSGEFFLSHTKLNGVFVLRVAIGNIHTSEQHVRRLWALCQKQAAALAG